MGFAAGCHVFTWEVIASDSVLGDGNEEMRESQGETGARGVYICIHF